MKGSILSLNAGSSRMKFALFNAAAPLTATVRGEIEDLDSTPHMVARNAAGTVLAEKRLPSGSDLAPHALLDFADNHLGRGGLAAVGHRIVHGGANYTVPEFITPVPLTALDPLHMTDNLAPINAVAAARPALMQVACFDTAFHHTMSSVAKGFAYALKEGLGNITGDSKFEADGIAERGAGKTQNAAGGARDTARDALRNERAAIDTSDETGATHGTPKHLERSA
jgi:acetate kinase